MNTEKKFGFATRQIHAGHMENAAGSLCAPIYQTSTYVLENFDAAVYLNQHADAGFSMR